MLEESQTEALLRGLFWLGVLLVTGFLVYQLAPVLTPFLLALILAYIFEPVVGALYRRRLSRNAAAALTMLLVGLGAGVMVLILVPLIQEQVVRLITQLPGWLESLRATVEPRLEADLGFDLDFAHLKALIIANLPSPAAVAAWVVPSITGKGTAIVAFFVNLVLVPVVLFYFLRDWDAMIGQIDRMIPRRWHASFTEIVVDIDRVLGEFLRGQLAVMAVMGLFYAVTLWLAGLEYAVAIGLLTGLLTFIPYVGAILGVVLATLVGLMQFQAIGPLIPIWIIFAAGQLLEGYAVVPKLVGDRIGLHPVLVIFALLAFGQLFGFFGVLLALPASAALLVWLRVLRRRYLDSNLYHT